MSLLLSIITVTYNAGAVITDNLSSISCQTLLPEQIVIDAESSDSTRELVSSIKHHHVKIISEPDNGIYDAMNKGIQLAKGDVLGFLNADDFYASGEVIEKVTRMFEDQSVDACYGDLCYVDSANTAKAVRYWRSGPYQPKSFYWGWMPPHPTFFVRRRVYEQYGVFNLDLGSAADYELMLRFMLKYEVKARYIPEVLVKMRVGGVSSRSIKNRLLANRNDRRAWEVNGLHPYPWTLLLKPIRKIPQWFIR